MKKLLPVVTVVVLLLSLSLALVGCSAEDKIVGTFGKEPCQYTFYEDGTWTVTGFEDEVSKWTYDKKTKTYTIIWFDPTKVWTGFINDDGDLVMGEPNHLLDYKRVKE